MKSFRAFVLTAIALSFAATDPLTASATSLKTPQNHVDTIVFNNNVIQHPIGLVIGKSTYLGIQDIQSMLNAIGVLNSWNGHVMSIGSGIKFSVMPKADSSKVLLYVKGKYFTTVPKYPYIHNHIIDFYIPLANILGAIKQLNFSTKWNGETLTVSSGQTLHPAPQTVIDATLKSTVEVTSPNEGFTVTTPPVVISDGKAGTITAVVGTRTPSADGLGQVVFFFHNNDFIGVDSNIESFQVENLLGSGTGEFTITYANYQASDPTGAPSLPPITFTYSWNGTCMVPSGQRPSGVGNSTSVRLPST